MRVLFVVPSYLPAVRYGGPIYSVHGLARGLVALGHRVVVATTTADGDGELDVPLHAEVDIDGVLVRYFRREAPRRICWAPTMGPWLAANLPAFDIVHLHAAFLWPIRAGARASAAAGVPYVVSPRGMLVKELVARKSRLVKSVWIRLVERRNLEQAAAVHVTSAVEGEALAAFRFRLPPLVEIGNGVDPPAGFVPADVAADIQEAAARGPFVLSLGRLNWKKNLPELIRAWRDVPDARLIIAGNDEDGHGAELGALVAREGLSDRIDIIARPILGADKEFLFDRCAAFVLPSLSENFGNTALEAMVRGRAVIATETTGAAAIVQAAQCGLIAACDAASLSAAIRQALSDPAELARMGERGRVVARDAFGWTAIAHRMAAAYERIIRRP